MILSKLFYSFTVYGKSEFLKSSVLTGRGEKRVVERDDLGISSFKYRGKPLDCILKK